MQIQATYNKTLKRNSATGYTLFTCILDKYDKNGNKAYKCRGNIPLYLPGTPLLLEGSLISEDSDVPTFNVERTDINLSEDKMLYSFVLSCLPAGMGKKKAEDFIKLLNKLKMSLEDFVINDKALDHLATLKGFSKSNSVLFLNKVENSLLEKNLYYSLAQYGIKFNQVDKICKKYTTKTSIAIKENPYKVFYEAGIPFSKIDAYYKDNNGDFCDENRIKALIGITNSNVMKLGHSYVPINTYIKIFRQTEKYSSMFDSVLPNSLLCLEICANSNVKVKNDIIYITEAFNAEKDIVANLKRLKKTSISLVDQTKIDKFKNKMTTFDDIQKSVLDLLNDSEPNILIGGPGTGKTTTIDKVVKCFKANCPDLRFALVAPTGRAAQKIKESTGEEALTIHMLLEYYFENGASVPKYNEDEKLDVDFLIVDEFSMVGIFLFNNLLKALKDGTKLLLVGDWNQLQSVEPGSLLHDMVESKKFKTVELLKIHRQAENSSIVSISKAILNGEGNIKEDKDTKIYHCVSNEEGQLLTKELYQKISIKDKNDDCVILCPQRKSDFGVASINSLIQGELHTTTEPYVTFNDSVFFENDKIMTIRNNYDSQYYNGDLWQLNKVLPNNEFQIINKDELTLDLAEDNLEDIDLAYAMTVHKCQGSEADTCIVFLPDNIYTRLKTRSLLYTAVTRAKRKLIIIEVNNSLKDFATAPLGNSRNSTIKDMLTEQV